MFAGLCAVDSRENVEIMFRALRDAGIHTTRAGAYKPRTSPYDFQGHGAKCLPFTFELAGKYGIRVIAMEVTSEQTAYNQPPHPGFHIGNGMLPPPSPNIVVR